MEEQKREFKGIWIPKEIYLDKRINWSEKILLVEIDSLDNEQGCFSSNKYFAEFLGVTERAITGMIAKLKELGYISQSSFDGRRRVLHSNVNICVTTPNGRSGQSRNELPCTPEPGFDQNNPVNNIYNNIESKEKVSDKPKRAPNFIPPLVEEVKAYCQERKNHVDAERFVDFYSAKGWLVGKTKMKDWKACVRTWERRDNETSGPLQKNAQNGGGFLC